MLKYIKTCENNKTKLRRMLTGEGGLEEYNPRDREEAQLSNVLFH